MYFALVLLLPQCLLDDRISKNNREEVLEKAEKDLAAVTDQHMSRLMKELQGTDFWKLRRAYSPGVQEYVEAATFFKFCQTGNLFNLDEINASLLPLSDPSFEPLQINLLDYLLGLADFTGELMRLPIGRISDGEVEFAERICWFVRDIYRELTLSVPLMDNSSDMKTKVDTMLQSVVKIENDLKRVENHPPTTYMDMTILLLGPLYELLLQHALVSVCSWPEERFLALDTKLWEHFRKSCYTRAIKPMTMPTLEPACPLSNDLPPVSLPKYLLEEGLTQECRQLIPSLPTEKGWVANHLHQYQGFWHTTRTTWLKAIVFALMNRVQYPNPETHPLLAENPRVLVPFLELGLYTDGQVADFTTLTSPRLFGTHFSLVSLPDSVKNSACKLVYLWRNLKDTFVSLWHFTNKLRINDMGDNSLEETFYEFSRGVSLYGPFWDHVLGYWKESLEKPQGSYS
ncbi:hypothetical protein CRYUN_Cryun21dG0022100 [Craigia yunnanensis]